MKYLRKFESFSINENEGQDPKMEEVVSQKVNALSDEDKEKAKAEITALAGKLGLSPEDMTDASKVEAALSKKEGELKLESNSVNEGLSEWWGRAKNSFYKWLTYTGIGGLVGGITSAAIGASMMSDATNLADYTGATVQPNTAAIVGGAAFVISLIATIVGMKGQETSTAGGSKSELSDGDRQIIANRKSRLGRRQ